MKEINTWPDWECVRQIGTGSFGKVYEIRREVYGKTYTAALKVISIPQNDAEIESAYSEGMDEQTVTDYFRDFVIALTEEFALMSELKGFTNIVSYEDHKIIEHKDSIGWDILIRMELLTPLQKWAQSHEMDEKTIVKLGTDITQALILCEEKHIIHRDIKPENIFVNSHGDFKLGDFGIARTVERTLSNLSKKGTYTYMAPEVYKGEQYGRTADIYSLATVLYRYLNHNRTPFMPAGIIKFSDRENALNLRMRGDPIPEPAQGNAQLKKIILKALEFDPKRRYQTAKEFQNALQQKEEEQKKEEREPQVYRLRFEDSDGSLIAIRSVEAGTVIRPPKITRPNFDGWSPDVPTYADRDQTFKAVFRDSSTRGDGEETVWDDPFGRKPSDKRMVVDEELPKKVYRLRFEDFDGSLIAIRDVAAGAVITPPKINRPNFVGWRPDVPTYANRDQTFKAVFKSSTKLTPPPDQTKRLVKITYQDCDGEYLTSQIYRKGDVVRPPYLPKVYQKEGKKFYGWFPTVLVAKESTICTAAYYADKPNKNKRWLL